VGLFQVVIQGPGEGQRIVDIPRTPWVIGRVSGAGLPLTGPGVFDRHLTVRSDPVEGWFVEVGEGALARIEGRPFQRHRLKNGDQIDVGNQLLRFVLSPVRRKSLVSWSLAFWVLLGVMVAAQAAVLVRLAGG
jgi:hypothetical protein